MKIRSLYKNLDTVFVDLSALLRHLRRIEFTGVVRIAIGSYKAEVVFDETHRVRMREFDASSGRIIESENGLERLLMYGKKPGGTIDVFEAVKTEKKSVKEEEKGDILDLAQNFKMQPPERSIEKSQRPEPGPVAEPPASKIPKPAEKKIFAINSEKVFANGNGNGNGNGKSKNGFHKEAAAAVIDNNIISPEQSAEDIFPLYSHPVEVVEEQPEMKKKASTFSQMEWEELIGTTAALLGTIDSILRDADLGFSDAFMKARIEVSNEYPFLHPLKGIFHYKEGKVTLTQEVPPNLLVSGISECLRRILNKLISNPKFFAVYKRVTQQILILVRQRQPQFDKFGYTRQLERIIKF